MAVTRRFGFKIDGVRLSLLAKRVENLICGAPCGIMDQMASVLGEKDRLLALRCDPANVLGTLPLPSTLAVWGLDSGIRHSVGIATRLCAAQLSWARRF